MEKAKKAVKWLGKGVLYTIGFAIMGISIFWAAFDLIMEYVIYILRFIGLFV